MDGGHDAVDFGSLDLGEQVLSVLKFLVSDAEDVLKTFGGFCRKLEHTGHWYRLLYSRET